MDSQRKVQSSALHYSPGFHRKDLPPIALAEVSLPPRAALSAAGTCEFRVGTPEVRCRIKGTLRWVPGAANPLTQPDDYHYLSGGPPAVPFSRFGETSLWLAKRDDVDLGGRGLAPVENLAGDIYAGLPVPDRGCLGFVFEAETTVPEIWGRFHVDCRSLPGAGRWVLSAAADAVDQMTDEEWARVSSRFYLAASNGLYLISDPEI